MTEILSTVTSKGQVTIPIEVRQSLGLKTGDKVAFTIEDSRVCPQNRQCRRGYGRHLQEPKAG